VASRRGEGQHKKRSGQGKQKLENHVSEPEESESCRLLENCRCRGCPVVSQYRRP
jgi:hypothetical protein